MQRWLVGQAVKTLASHAENMGSIPVRVTKTKGHPLRVSFLFCRLVRHRTQHEHALRVTCYGFATLLRRLPRRPRKAEQIPVRVTT